MERGEQLQDNSVEEVSKVFLKKLSILLKKQLTNNKLVKNISRALLNEAPTAFEGLSKKVKNKKISMLNSDIAKTGVNLATYYTLDKLQ